MIVIITALFGMFSAAMETLITATILSTIISSLGIGVVILAIAIHVPKKKLWIIL